MFGCRVYPVPPDFEECGTAENAMVYMPDFDPPVAAVVAGYIPAPDHYAEVYEAAAAKGVRLVNRPAQFETAMEFDKFYPLLGELTPESAVISSLDELAVSASRLPFPLFVKGAIKSNKDQGWAACVASNAGEEANPRVSFPIRSVASRATDIQMCVGAVKRTRTSTGCPASTSS